jgi:lipoprotein-releasing system ATP-binding protein
MSDPIIHLHNIYKSYPTGGNGSLDVLRGVSLQIQKGSVVAIIGASGVGKSTMLHIMGALDRPSSGTMTIRGQELFKLPDNELATFRNKHLGFVFQFHHLLPEFSAMENVAMPALIAGQTLNTAEIRARELLKLVHVDHRADAKPAQLSGGEQQRVAVARALMNEPTLLLADEPSGNLDEENAERLHDLLWALARDNGQTIVVVTHDRHLAQRADVVYRIHEGQLVHESKETENFQTQ